MTGCTIAAVFGARELGGAREALRCEDRVVTYEELLERSGGLAAGLRAAGAGPGDRFASLLRNSVEAVELFLAAARIGAVVVPIAIGQRGLEVDYQLRESGAGWLVADPSGWDVARHLVGGDTGIRPLAVGADLWTHEGERALPLKDLVAGAGEPAVDPAVGPEQSLLVRFALGTAELPRAWELSHAELLADADGLVAELGLGPDDVYVSTPGRCWATDCDDLSLACWLAGATVCLSPPRRFSPADHCGWLEANQATVTVASASELRMMLASGALAAADLSSLRRFCVADSHVAPALLEEAAGVLPHCELTGRYGHPGFAAALTTLSAGEAPARPGSAGHAAVGRELEILGPDGAALPAGLPGAVACRAAGKASAAAGEGGWLATGDRGYLDADGYLYIVEPWSKAIVSGGLEVRIAEVEAALGEHGEVAEVSLVRMADDRLGEAIQAHFVPAAGSAIGTAELEEYARSRLAPYKVPVEWVAHDGSLPPVGCGLLENYLPVASVAAASGSAA
jgi:acyl-CoA synthetase (AMP-forming)/AMP-acid ligase II